MRDPAWHSIGRHPKETVAVASIGLEDWKAGLESGKMREKLWRGRSYGDLYLLVFSSGGHHHFVCGK